MHIKDYKVSNIDIRESLNIEGMAKKLKRDFFITFGITLILIFFSHKRPIIEAVSWISFALVFVVFIVRLVVFTRSSGPLECSQCGSILEKLKKVEKSYLVCHECRTIYFAYEASTDPDKIFEEIKLTKDL